MSIEIEPPVQTNLNYSDIELIEKGSLTVDSLKSFAESFKTHYTFGKVKW
jgi:hypothetical protein